MRTLSSFQHDFWHQKWLQPLLGKCKQLLNQEQKKGSSFKTSLAWLALCAAPLLAQASNCTGDNADAEYILGEAEGTASAMHWPTGLVWKRCVEGMTYSSGQCTGAPTSNKWLNLATSYLPKYFTDSGLYPHSAPSTQNLLASGAWRMAYKNELISITQSCGNNPRVNRMVFPDTPSSYVWSGSPNATYSDVAWVVNFSNGYASSSYRNYGNHVRLVRAGQSFASLNAPPITQNAAAGATAVGFTTTITLASAAGATVWGGVRFQNGSSGSPQLQVNGGAWVTQAIVKTGDIIAVRMDAPASGSHTATLEVRSGQTMGTNASGSNGGSESTAVQTTTATFTLNTPENGACGSALGQPTLAAPSANLCSAGTASALTGDASGWTWTCDGSIGGAQASCQAPKGYTVTPLASANGSISPATAQVVAVNTQASFTVTPQAGYSAVVGGTCGGNLSGSTYTTQAMSADCTVEVSFIAIASHAITASASPAHGGAVVCAPNPVLHGGNSTCVARSNAYRFMAWTGACAGHTGPSCTLINVRAAQIVGVQWDTSTVLGQALNDTGVSLSGADNSVNASTCDSTHPSAQDCHHGRDAGALSGQLSKVGASASTSNGFDYTKVCNSGELAGQGTCPSDPILGNQAHEWACTRDNVTGLIWEVKTTSGLRDADYLYTWFNPHSPDGDPGAENPSTFDCETAGRCDTAKFVEDVNAAGLCGAHDWRLPTVQELGGLVDMGQPAGEPAIDPVYFPHTPLMPFWSSTPFANAALGGGVPSAWFVDFDHDSVCGGDCFTDRVLPMSVRLVRSGQ